MFFLEKRFVLGTALLGYTLMGISLFHGYIGTERSARAVVVGFAMIVVAVVLYGIRALVLSHKKEVLKQQFTALRAENDRLRDQMGKLGSVLISFQSCGSYHALRDASGAHLPPPYALLTEPAIPPQGDDMRGITCLRIKIATEEERKRCYMATQERILAEVEAWGNDHLKFVDAVAGALSIGTLSRHRQPEARASCEIIRMSKPRLLKLRNRWRDALMADPQHAKAIAREIGQLRMWAEIGSHYMARSLPVQ